MSLVTVLRSPCRSTDNSPTGDQEQPADATDGEPEDRKKSISECYFAVKGTALILPHDESVHIYRCPNNNVVAGDIRAHLQSMLYMLRREDTLKMAVKLESMHPSRTRYLAVVVWAGAGGAEEACLLGIDCNHRTSIGLVIPVWADTRITLDGDGGFSITSSSGHYIFKPVSVQAMWSALQSLHKACAKAREFNYFQGGSTHLWAQYYADRIHSDQSCLNEWHAMDDLVSRRPPSPDSSRSKPTEKEETEALIKSKLKELMMSLDLDEVTSKFIRSRLEEELDMNLNEFKPFIDQEMLTILGQMDAATEILEYLYLGSEWNASNLEELKDKGVGHILNVTREIDNFYPGHFKYFNIRVYDDEATEMLKHWDKTYKYIAQAREQGSKVLVHCKMGISRSASVVIAYVMKANDWNLEQALEFVRTRRSCIKPNSGFLKQLETYQGILSASKQRHNSIWRSKSETNLKYEKPRKNKSQDEVDGKNCSEALKNQMNLLMPGTVSRPKSWSPDDLSSEILFPEVNADSSTGSIAAHRSRSGRRRSHRHRFATDPSFYGSTETESRCGVEDSGGHPRLAIPQFMAKSCTDGEEQGLHRVASVKDRICELESQKLPENAKQAKSSWAPPDGAAKSKPVLKLAGQFAVSNDGTHSPPEDDPASGSDYAFQNCGVQAVEPIVLHTKPPTPKHQAVLIKPALPRTINSEKCEAGTSAPVSLPGASNQGSKTAVCWDAVPQCPFLHGQDDLGHRGTSHTEIPCPPVHPSTMVSKLQIGFMEDTAHVVEARKEIILLSPHDTESDARSFSGANLHTDDGIRDAARLPVVQGKVHKTKLQLEQRNFTRSVYPESGFPLPTRSTPSTPPETRPDVEPCGRQILRSQSLRCEHRPKSLALPKYVPASSSLRQVSKLPPRQTANDRDGPNKISHSVSATSVVEAVNEVLCETRQVISSAMQSVPCPANTAESVSPRTLIQRQDQGPELVNPSGTTCPTSSGQEACCTEVPLVGIVKQQKAVLEGRQPCWTGKAVPSDDLRAKKEQFRIIKELGSSLVPAETSEEPDEDEVTVGVVKRLTKELEAKTSSGKVKQCDRLVIVGQDGYEIEDARRPGGSASTPNSPTCERHHCGSAVWERGEFATDPAALPGKSRSHPETRRPEPPSVPGRKASLELENIRRHAASRNLSAFLEQHCMQNSQSKACATGGILQRSQSEAPCLLPPRSPSLAAAPYFSFPGVQQKKVRKQQGKTHPLSKLTARQRHTNPLYNTM